MNRQQAIEFLKTKPMKFGHLLGFTDLKPIHNEWIRNMLFGKGDYTLQASRGTYKTTCVSVGLAEYIILLPKLHNMFMRKTDTDVKEVIKQVQKILQDPHTQYLTQCIYGVSLKMPVQSATEITTNLVTGVRGTPQLLGIGSKGSLTGKHFDRIFTDDIVNIDDRTSRAERDRTKLVYQELQNIKNRGIGRIINTGTPWHPEDCFSIMPKAEKWDCYSIGLFSDEELAGIKAKMLPSLFAANYELRHIASENVIFTEPQTGAEDNLAETGLMHLDSAFFGEDYTAWTIMKMHGGKYYCYGQIRREHVEECFSEIMDDYQRFRCAKIYNETNADKGMVGKELRKLGAKVILYHEDMNKYLKIVTHLKKIWDQLIFTQGTNPEFIGQVCDYWENAAHDDAPDSLASLARIFNKKPQAEYKPIWN